MVPFTWIQSKVVIMHTNHVEYYLSYHLQDRFQFFQALSGGNGEDKDKCVSWIEIGDQESGMSSSLPTFRYGQSLHGRELVAAGGVGDLQGADGLVAGDDLPAGGVCSWYLMRENTYL